ncbi:MAG: hypothetical protein HY698_17780, partial [Deltaproteobacteria bacterium]|nr:hypothetical protein [Deltaproteobacteria bacterium]
GLRWSQSSTGHTVIRVCLVDGSTTQQKDSSCSGCIHDTNPGLTEVVTHVKDALISSWEAYSGVRFVGWQWCSSLTTQERASAVGLYIHPDTSNAAHLGTNARGRTTVSDSGVHFKPWGNDTACINYNWRTTHMEYSFDCVEQYAIHEFGHVLGFEHEWRHPNKPSSCATRQNEPPVTSWSKSTSTSAQHTVVNPSSYDWDSIMVYDRDCADVTGVRFGSPTLSSIDIEGMKAVYPAAKSSSSEDTVVIPDLGGSYPGCSVTVGRKTAAQLPVVALAALLLACFARRRRT